MLSAEPKCRKSRMLMLLPSFAMPNKLILEERRMKLRIESADPTHTLSKSDRHEPSLTSPYTLSDEPTRAKRRRDVAEPSVPKARTDSEEPKRAIE
jgi:hypothetical protein